MIDVQGISKLDVVILRWMLIDEIDFLIYKERVKQYLEKKKSKKIFSIKRIHDGGEGGKKGVKEKETKCVSKKKANYTNIHYLLYFCMFSLCKMAKSTNKLFCASCLFAGD